MKSAGKRKNFIFKFLTILVLSIILAEQAFIPAAKAGMGSLVEGALGNSISSVTTGQAGYYHAQGEGIYTLGYTRIRFSVTPGDTSLFTIQPPQFSVGCSGIDLMGGAFAMVSGAQLEKLLQSLMAAAIPFAFNMALGVLCKQCESILNQIEAIANKLNGLNFNSCKTAQAAAGALTNMLNSVTGSGNNSSWSNALNGVLGKVGGGGTPVASSGGLEGVLASFESAIPSSNCQGGTITNNSTGGNSYTVQTIYNSISDCGASQVQHKLFMGSLLRTIANHSNLGLTGGGSYLAGTGGVDDLLGIIRGSILGDVYGYINNTSTSPSLVKYHTFPVYLNVSENGTSNQNNSNSVYSVLLTGTTPSQGLRSVIIARNTVNTDYGANVGTGSTVDAGDFYTTSSTNCFPGFNQIYGQYLKAIYQSLYGVNITVPTHAGCGAPQVSVTPTIVAQIVTSTNIPVIRVVKLAYVLREPALINEASSVIGAQALAHWLQTIINGINMNIYAGRNFNGNGLNGKNQINHYLAILAAFQKRAITVEQYYHNYAKRDQRAMTILMKTLDTSNKDWIAQLESAGLMGNYNFSKHLQ